MSKQEKELENAQINLRVKASAKAKLQKQAEEKGKKLSAYIKGLLKI